MNVLKLPDEIICEILGSAGNPLAKRVCSSFRRLMKDHPQVLVRAFGNAYGNFAVYRLFNDYEEAFSRHVARVISVLEVVNCDNIGSDGMLFLADALKTNTSLRTLNLRFNETGAEGARALADALKTNTTLQTLDLGRNWIGNEGVRALADALKTNTTLHTLELDSNMIGDEGARALADALKTNTTLHTLDLGGRNWYGIKGHQALADARNTNRGMHNLYL